MKKLMGLFLCSIMMFAFSQVAMAENDGIIVYKDINFKGKQYRINADKEMNMQLLAGEQIQDEISSVKVVGKVTAYLYEHENFRGLHLVIDEDIPDLQDYEFNDRISSIKVMPAMKFKGLIVYKHINFKGFFIRIPAGQSVTVKELKSNGLQDAISSIKVVGNVNAHIFMDDNFKGAEKIINAKTIDLADLSKIGFNDNISSIKVVEAKK